MRSRHLNDQHRLDFVLRLRAIKHCKHGVNIGDIDPAIRLLEQSGKGSDVCIHKFL
jgi:DNA-binding transcriptional MerR regulator